MNKDDTAILIPQPLVKRLNTELSAAQTKRGSDYKEHVIDGIFLLIATGLAVGALQFLYQTEAYVANNPDTWITAYGYPEWFSFGMNGANLAFFSFYDLHDLLDDIKHPSWRKFWINVFALGGAAIAATVNKASSALVIHNTWILNLIWAANIFLWYPGIRKNLDHLTMPAINESFAVKKRCSDIKTIMEEKIEKAIRRMKEFPGEPCEYCNIYDVLNAKNLEVNASRPWLKWSIFFPLLVCYVGGCFGSYSAMEKNYHWALAFVSIATNIGYGIHTAWVIAGAVSSIRFECSWKNLQKTILLLGSVALALPTYASALRSYQMTLGNPDDRVRGDAFELLTIVGNVFTNSYGFFWIMNNVLEKWQCRKIQQTIHALETAKKIIREATVEGIQSLLPNMEGYEEYKIDSKSTQAQSVDQDNPTDRSFSNSSTKGFGWADVPQPASSASESNSEKSSAGSLHVEANSQSTDGPLLPQNLAMTEEEKTIEKQIFSAKKNIFDHVLVASVLFGVAYFVDPREETLTPSLAWLKNIACLAVFFASKVSDWSYARKEDKKKATKNLLCKSMTSALFDAVGLSVGMPAVSWFFVGLIDNAYLLKSTIAVLGTPIILKIMPQVVEKVVEKAARFVF